MAEHHQNILLYSGDHTQPSTRLFRLLHWLGLAKPQTPRKWHRMAVIFLPYGDTEALEINEHLFIEAIGRIVRLIEHDEVIVCTDGICQLQSIEELSCQYFEQPFDDRDFPDRMELKRQGAIVALLEIEKWAMVGGPYPYSDSYTIALYTPESVDTKVSRCVRDVAREFRANVRDHLLP